MLKYLNFYLISLEFKIIKKMTTEEINLIKELKENGFELSDKAMVWLSDNSLTIGILEINNKSNYFGQMAFASEVTIYNKTLLNKKETDLTINFGTSGSFTPENKSSYWKTIHAATILKNWGVFCKIMKKYFN